MAGNLATVGNNGVAAGKQPLDRSSSERQVQRDIGELGKALETNDVVAAQSAVAALRSAAPTQNRRTDFANAVKALDQALKTNDAKGATAAFAQLQQGARRAPVQQQAVPAEQTRVRQQSGQAQVAQKVSQQDFLTRQDLAAKVANHASPVEQPPVTGVGKHIDTQA